MAYVLGCTCIVPALLLIKWAEKCGLLGRVVLAPGFCGHSFGRKDADRPVVF